MRQGYASIKRWVRAQGGLTAMLILVLAGPPVVGQSYNLHLVGRILVSASGGNDVWGYTAPDGTDYAIMGTGQGVAFVRVPNAEGSSALEIVAEVPHAPGSWRDMKTYRHYAYAVSEQNGVNEGLLIMDLQYLPDSVRVVRSFEIMDFQGQPQQRSHNLYIDTDRGNAYVVERNYDGVIIFNLDDPENPARVAEVPTPDAHDMFVQNERLYIAEGTSGTFSIYDVADPSNPQLITRVDIPGAGYVHNIWVSEDGKTAMTTEETQGKTVKVWDLSDMQNIELTGDYLGPNNLAHNTHLKDGFAYISHYTAGLAVVDVRDPYQPVEVARYDTYLANDQAAFRGCWGAYPYAGNYVYASDIEGYLTVLEFKDEPLSALSCPLDTGWNLVSSNVRPNYLQMPAVVAAITPDMTLVRNNEGTMYWPGQNIQDLELWDETQGYQVLMENPATLTFEGPYQGASAPVELDAGWNTMAYLPALPLPADEAVASIEGSFVLIKDSNGLPYWPDQQINALGAMEPCKGYQVFMTEAATLRYPEAPGKRSTEQDFTLPPAPRHFIVEHERTGRNALLLVEAATLADGDEIGAWSSAGLVGSGRVRNGRALVVVWGDDDLTDQPDGSLAGEALELHVWHQATGRERAADVVSVVDGLTGSATELAYHADAVLVVSLARSTGSETGDALTFEVQPNYPNPFRDVTTLRYRLPDAEQVTVRVYDALGRLVRTLVDEGQEPGLHQVRFEAAGLPAGVYFFQIQAGTHEDTRRMTLVTS